MKYIPADGFPYYRNLVEETDCTKLFNSSSTSDFLTSIDEAKSAFRYHPDKWSIKQIVGHLTDHERIKMYRTFMLSRKNSAELWGYDQNYLMTTSRFESLSYGQILADYVNVRKASASFIETLSEDQLKYKGSARGLEISLENFLRSIIGHEIHHINVIKACYL